MGLRERDMPAFPLTGDAYQDLQGTSRAQGHIELGMGLTKLEHTAIELMKAIVSKPERNILKEIKALSLANSLWDELEKPR